MEKYISIKNKFIIYQHGDFSKINRNAEKAWSKTVAYLMNLQAVHPYPFLLLDKEVDVVYSKIGNSDKRPCGREILWSFVPFEF